MHIIAKKQSQIKQLCFPYVHNTEFLIYNQSKEIDECLTKFIMCNPSSLVSIVSYTTSAGVHRKELAKILCEVGTQLGN